MRALLSDPALCGWPPGQITVIENPASAADLADQVADLAESTTGVLLLYYVGHGALSTRGELCLTVTSTRPSRPKFSGLAWENLADILRACPARTRLVILDCCFAGQAIEALSADGEPGLADIAHVNGVYTLTATTRNRTAHVPPPGQQDTACTSFTGELRDLIRSGIPGRPARLTLGDIYPVLRQRLRDRGLPAPSQRGTDTAYLFPFTTNAAARAGPDAHHARPDTPATVSHLQEAQVPRRPGPQYFRFCLACVVLFIVSLVGYNFTSPRTQPQVMVGWVLGLSGTAAVLSFGPVLRNLLRDHRNRAMRDSAEAFLKPGETVQAVFGAHTVSRAPTIALVILGLNRYRIFLVTSQRILVLDAGKVSMKYVERVEAEIPRSTRLGPPLGRRHVISVDGRQVQVGRDFFKDIEAADRAAPQPGMRDAPHY